MPKVTMFYDDHMNGALLLALITLGTEIKPLIAELASTPDVQLTKDDIDWVPQPYPQGSSAPLSIEIETIGYPARIERFSREAVLELKKKILALPSFPPTWKHLLKRDAPLIWIKFQDPRGVHV